MAMTTSPPPLSSLGAVIYQPQRAYLICTDYISRLLATPIPSQTSELFGGYNIRVNAVAAGKPWTARVDNAHRLP